MDIDNKSSSDLIILELLRIVQDLDMKVTSSLEECDRHIAALRDLERKIGELELLVVQSTRPWFKKLLRIH